MKATASTILLDAAALIVRDGWCQGRSRDDRGQRCALEAMWQAYVDTHGKGSWRDCHWLSVLNALKKAAGYEGGVSWWNDMLPADTGKETVIATLMAAAEAVKVA